MANGSWLSLCFDRDIDCFKKLLHPERAKNTQASCIAEPHPEDRWDRVDISAFAPGSPPSIYVSGF